MKKFLYFIAALILLSNVGFATTYTVTVSVQPEEAATITGAGEYAAGAMVTLTAIPDDRYVLGNWVVNGFMQAESELVLEFEMPEENVTAVVSFNKKSYSLTLTAEPETFGTVTGGGNYEWGNWVTVTATPEEGYAFAGWFDDEITLVSDRPVLTFEMPANNLHLTAIFKNTCALTIDVDAEMGEWIIDIPGFVNGNEVAIGETVTITATANQGYIFTGWYISGELLSNNNEYEFEVPDLNSYIIFAAFTESDPEDENVIVIRARAQLVELAYMVNEGLNVYLNKTVELAADLDLAEINWTPIGHMRVNNNFARAFQGTFDGKNHTISNLTVLGQNHVSTLNSQVFAGLFGYAYNAEIKNLNLTNVFIEVNYRPTINQATVFTGAIAAFNMNSIINNCHVEGAINLTSQRGITAGGIAGYSRAANTSFSSTIKESSFTGNISGIGFMSAGATNSFVDIGGITGMNEQNIINCVTNGTVRSQAAIGSNNANAGGISGRSANLNHIDSCRSNAEIQAYSFYYSHAGGITGIVVTGSANSKITSSSTTGDVSAVAAQYAAAGGIAGRVHAGLIEICYAKGDVYAASPTRDPFAGGLIGNNNARVFNCYATGNAVAIGRNNYAYAGGLIAANSIAGVVENSYATGNTHSESLFASCAGGFVGFNSGNIVNSFGIGNASAYTIGVLAGDPVNGAHIGGFVGFDDNGIHNNCFSYVGQTFVSIHGQTVVHEASNNIGIAVDFDMYDSEIFYSDTLEWDAGIWNYTNLNFTNGRYPIFWGSVYSYFITLLADPNHGGIVSGGGTYEENTSITIEATSHVGYNFVNWTEDGMEVSTDTAYSFTVTSDRTLTANFVVKTYTITATFGDNGTITPSGEILVTHGDNKTFEIIPDANYKIEQVVVNGVPVGAVTSYTFNDVTADATIIAYFEYDVNIIENKKSTINVFSHGSIVTIVNEELVPIKQVKVMDMHGRIIWKGQATDVRNEITLNVAAGIYGVRIITENNQQFTTKININ